MVERSGDPEANPTASELGCLLHIPGASVAWRDDLPELPPSAEALDGIRQVGERVEIEVDGVARYHVVSGNRIEIQVAQGSDRETAWFFLKATPFGILVQQRGEFPLHAGALVPPGVGKALLVAGDSGAGKSTACAALMRRGWTLLNDDLSRLTFDSCGAVVWPGFRSLKLGADAARLLGLNPSDLARTRGFKEKYYLPAPGGDPPAAQVAAMVVLEESPGFSPPERVAGMDLLGMVYRQTFRPHLVVPLGFQRDHYAQVMRFAGAVPCFRVRGNRQLAPDLLAQVLDEWFSGVVDLGSGS